MKRIITLSGNQIHYRLIEFHFDIEIFANTQRQLTKHAVCDLLYILSSKAIENDHLINSI